MVRFQHQREFSLIDENKKKKRKQRVKKAKQRKKTITEYGDKIRSKNLSKTSKSKKLLSPKRPSSAKMMKKSIKKMIITKDDEIDSLKQRCQELEHRYLQFVLRGNPNQIRQVQDELSWIAAETREAANDNVDMQYAYETNQKLQSIIANQQAKILELQTNMASYSQNLNEKKMAVTRIETCTQMLLQYLNQPVKRIRLHDMTLGTALHRLENAAAKCTAMMQTNLMQQATSAITPSRKNTTIQKPIHKPPDIDIGAIIRECKTIHQMGENSIQSTDQINELSKRVTALDSALQQSQNTIDTLLGNTFRQVGTPRQI